MSVQLFSKDFHNKAKKNVENEFKFFIADLRRDLEEGFTTDIISDEFVEQLDDIVHDESFDKFSPQKFYWLNLVDNLIYLIQLHEEIIEDGPSLAGDELSEAENELFTFWNDSELAEIFLNMLNAGANVFEASEELIPMLENQIISFYVLHINQYHQEFSDAVLYHVVPEIGDGEKWLYIGDKHLKASITDCPESFPSIPINAIDFDDACLNYTSKEKEKSAKLVAPPAPLELEETTLYILPNCEVGEKNLTSTVSRVKKALSIIKSASPELYQVFKSFTHTIVPVNESGIVSYSMQSLPGYSSINVFERDDVDLIDDLLHENGHHFLNTILNYSDLINEDDEKIYYSPWRKALRPVRGIYHASFTFYWALELFSKLVEACENGKIKLSSQELQKCRFRFLEEYYMLKYCWPDLKHAYKNKKINKEGQDLISQIFAMIDKKENQAKSVLKEIQKSDAKSFEKLEELRMTLEKMRAQYGL